MVKTVEIMQEDFNGDFNGYCQVEGYNTWSTTPGLLGLCCYHLNKNMVDFSYHIN